MLALLHKDFLMLRKEKIVWLVLALALFGGLASGGSPATAVFLLFFPVYWATAYSNAYDYKYGAEAVLASLPLPRAGVVGAKYLLAAAVSLFAILLALVGGILYALVKDGVFQSLPAFLVAALGLCNCFSAIALAAYFRFGYLRSRWVVIGFFVAPSVVIGILSGSSGLPAAGGRSAASAISAFLSGLQGPAILFAASLAALGLSFLYASRVFARKEF